MIEAKFEDGINDLLVENLYQWDTYQTLKISGVDFGSVAPKVHFCNKKSTEALAVQGVLNDDGSANVSIPNTLLAEKYDILAYVYTNSGFTNKTIKSITIPLISRLKPSEYTQASNEDIIEIEAIELQAQAILNDLKASEFVYDTEYKRPNIVYYDGNMYMCKNVSVNHFPTDTNYWQLICKGSYLTGMTTDSSGNLQFTYKDGTSYTVPISASNAEFLDVTLLEGVPSDYATNGITKTGLYCISITGQSSIASVFNGGTLIQHQCYLYITDLTTDFETTIILPLNVTSSTYSICKVKFNHATAKIGLSSTSGPDITSEYVLVVPFLVIGG